MTNDTLTLNIAAGQCNCGCGGRVVRPKASFLPGHDARLKGILARHIAQPGVGFSNAYVRVTDGVGELDYDVQDFMARHLSDKLRAKVLAMVDNVTTKDAEKRQRAADRAARKAAKAEQVEDEPELVEIQAKVGRWVKTGVVHTDGNGGETFEYVDSNGDVQFTDRFTLV